jgi:amylovoran biosynthesis glycosyltransferase AmsD
LFKETKHILLLSSGLNYPGGIERAIVNTANLFAVKGHRVTIIVFDESDKSFYPIKEGIYVVRYPLYFGITGKGNLLTRKIEFLFDIIKLRKIIKELKPDVVIGTEYPFSIAAVLAGVKKQALLFSWEHHHFNELNKSQFWHKLFKITYPRLNGIVCLNEDERNIFSETNSYSFVIPNFIESKQFNFDRTLYSEKLILTVARLTSVKGIDLLLPIAKKILEKWPEWRWKIIGNGNMKESVIKFIKKEDLDNRLILQEPISHDIDYEYKNASIYVMTSRNECFPMTLLEAMSNGLPCIAFDCETGPRHIIESGINGYLVEDGDLELMIAAINNLIGDAEKRNKMGENAFHNVQRFSPDKVYSLWEKLINF